jgi:hypothetical protein
MSLEWRKICRFLGFHLDFLSALAGCRNGIFGPKFKGDDGKESRYDIVLLMHATRDPLVTDWIVESEENQSF